MKKFLFLLIAIVALCFQSAAQSATVTLIWDPSTSAGTKVLTYRMYVNGLPAYSNIASTNLQITNLTAGTTYQFYVTAVETSTGIESPPSNTLLLAPSLGVPPAPSLASQSITVLSGNQWRITLTWLDVGAQYVVTNYLVVCQQGSTFTTNQVGTNLTATTTVSIFSPTVFSLQAQNNQGFSPLNQVVAYLQPGAPRSLRAVQP
jgi:hypothetical protein